MTDDVLLDLACDYLEDICRQDFIKPVLAMTCELGDFSGRNRSRVTKLRKLIGELAESTVTPPTQQKGGEDG